MKGKQNPVEKEWAAVVKAEERFLRHAMPARTAGWQEKITRYVPQKLETTLHTAFYKAFELIFDRGTPVIEKTYQREKKEQNYKINAYTAEVRDTRHALRAFGREAGAIWRYRRWKVSAWDFSVWVCPIYRCSSAFC